MFQVPLPKYYQVYQLLCEQLAEGRFATGLPSELALMDEFGVARVTVRRAIEKMVAEGLVGHEPGHGSRYIGKPAALAERGRHGMPAASLGDLFSKMASPRTSGRVIAMQLEPASPTVAAALRLKEGTEVQKVVLVRSVPDGPLAHIITYMPVELAQRYNASELVHKPSLALLEEASVLRVGAAHQSITTGLADETLAQRLEVPVGSALLIVERLVRDVNEKPVQWLLGAYRPDRYAYEMELPRPGCIDAKVWIGEELSTQFGQPPGHAKTDHLVNESGSYVAAHVKPRQRGDGAIKTAP